MTFKFDEKDKVQFSFHNFNEIPELLGILRSVEEGTYGDQYTIFSQEGELVIVGSYTTLVGKITKADVGSAIKIVYKGMKPGKKREYMDFDVYLKKVAEMKKE